VVTLKVAQIPYFFWREKGERGKDRDTVGRCQKKKQKRGRGEEETKRYFFCIHEKKGRRKGKGKD